MFWRRGDFIFSVVDVIGECEVGRLFWFFCVMQIVERQDIVVVQAGDDGEGKLWIEKEQDLEVWLIGFFNGLEVEVEGNRGIRCDLGF